MQDFFQTNLFRILLASTDCGEGKWVGRADGRAQQGEAGAGESQISSKSTEDLQHLKTFLRFKDKELLGMIINIMINEQQ